MVVWNCGDEECGICNVLCDCCVMSDVENYAMCQMWWCNVKSRCGGAMRCGICCGLCRDVECGCGIVGDVEFCEMWTVAV